MGNPITITRDKTVTTSAAQALESVGGGGSIDMGEGPAASNPNVQLEGHAGPRVFGPEGEAHGDPGTLEGILGLDRVSTSRHQDPAVQHVLEGSEREQLSQEMQTLKEENQYLKSERGRYGREVVGPMREELDSLRSTVDKVIAAPQSNVPPAPQAPASTEDVARSLFGPDVDVTDPAVLRSAQASAATFDAVQASVQAALKPVTEALSQVATRVDAQVIATEAGITQQDVQKVVALVPTLAKLPYEDQVSAIRDLRKAGGQAPAQAQSPSAAVAYQNPADHIEGGSAVFSDPNEQGADAAAAQFERYKQLGLKGGAGASAMQNVFMDRLSQGAFD